MNERYLSISESLKAGFQLWSKHFKKIIIVGLLVYIPVQVLIELISVLFTDGTAMDLSNDDFSTMNNLYNLIRGLIGSIATLAILGFTLTNLDDEKELSIQDSLKIGFSKWGTYIVVRISAGIKVFLYLLMLVVPGVIKSVQYSFIDCVVVSGKNSMKDECDESTELVENNWWNVFGLVIILFVVQAAIEALFLVVLNSYVDNHIISIVGGVIVCLLQSYTIVVKAHYFYTLRSLKTKPLEEVESIGEPMAVKSV